MLLRASRMSGYIKEAFLANLVGKGLGATVGLTGKAGIGAGKALWKHKMPVAGAGMVAGMTGTAIAHDVGRSSKALSKPWLRAQNRGMVGQLPPA